MLAYPSFSVAGATSFANSWFIGCSLAVIYFAPALVAFFRRQQNSWFILVLNVLFGWTIVGWIICLAWAASAPAGAPVVGVQTIPPFQTGEVIVPEQRPQSFKVLLFRLAVAAISLTIVAGATASQWKDGNSSTVSHRKDRNNRIPQIRNIDPYMPSPSNAVPKRHYPSMPARSHEGYY
jgi:T4 superinfection immunity protein